MGANDIGDGATVEPAAKPTAEASASLAVDGLRPAALRRAAFGRMVARGSRALSTLAFAGLVAATLLTALTEAERAPIERPTQRLAEIAPGMTSGSPSAAAGRSGTNASPSRMPAEARAPTPTPTPTLRAAEQTVLEPPATRVRERAAVVAASPPALAVPDSSVGPPAVMMAAADVGSADKPVIVNPELPSVRGRVEVAAPQLADSDHWPADEVAAGRIECDRLLAGLDIVQIAAEPVRQGRCGIAAPVAVSRIGRSRVLLEPPVVMNCPMAARLARWVDDTLQPAAAATRGQPVRRLVHASSYACRNRYGLAKAPLSEHALGNALDVAGFEFADGRRVMVVSGWGATARDIAAARLQARTAPPDAGSLGVAMPLAHRAQLMAEEPRALTSRSGARDVLSKRARIAAQRLAPVSPPDVARDQRRGLGGPTAAMSPATAATADPAEAGAGKFLRQLHAASCKAFGTVLGPEANEAHRDHFHLDLKPRRSSPYCE